MACGERTHAHQCSLPIERLVPKKVERIATPFLGGFSRRAPFHALASSDFEAARKKARMPLAGPFAGVPFLMKDLLSYPGQRCCLGSRLFAQNLASAGSSYTERLDSAGLITLGKTTTSELGVLGSPRATRCNVCWRRSTGQSDDETMATFKLRESAEDDLVHIGIESQGLFGRAQMERYVAQMELLEAGATAALPDFTALPGDLFV